MFADSHVTLLRVNNREADPRYLAYVLGLLSFRSFVEEGLSVGATKQRELNVEALRAHRLNVLDSEAQASCSDFLDRECERIAVLGPQEDSSKAGLLGEFESLLIEYRDALITEAVTGKLDVTRLSDQQLDESARAVIEGEKPEVLSA